MVIGLSMFTILRGFHIYDGASFVRDVTIFVSMGRGGGGNDILNYLTCRHYGRNSDRLVSLL